MPSLLDVAHLGLQYDLWLIPILFPKIANKNTCFCFKTIVDQITVRLPWRGSDIIFCMIKLYIHIDVGSDVVVWTINWLNYLNCEAITCSSSTRYYFLQGTSLGQTISSYGCCNGIPRFFTVFSLFRERLHVWSPFLSILRQTYTWCPCHKVHNTVVGFVGPYVCTTLSHPCTTVWFWVITTIWFVVSTEFAHSCTTLWSILCREFSYTNK